MIHNRLRGETPARLRGVIEGAWKASYLVVLKILLSTALGRRGMWKSNTRNSNSFSTAVPRYSGLQNRWLAMSAPALTIARPSRHRSRKPSKCLQDDTDKWMGLLILTSFQFLIFGLVHVACTQQVLISKICIVSAYMLYTQFAHPIYNLF